MSTKNIPARTITVCDRCSCETENVQVVSGWLTLQRENGRESIDLCLKCKSRFEAFMDEPYTKSADQ